MGLADKDIKADTTKILKELKVTKPKGKKYMMTIIQQIGNINKAKETIERKPGTNSTVEMY